MTRQENLIYRKQCPYDAMGDYSVLMENEKNIKTERTENFGKDNGSVD